ncbi:MAG: acyl-CoA thioesterase, partial [Candidatus Limnocylindria bacterium]
AAESPAPPGDEAITMSYRFERDRQVFVGEDDGAGLIFFVNYFRYMSEALQLIWSEFGQSLADQIREGVGAPAVHASCDFIAPVRTGDVLRQQVELELGNRASFTTTHRFWNVNGELVASGNVTRVWADIEAMKALDIPTWLRAAINSH